MNPLKFVLPALFGLLVVAAVACDNIAPAASPDDTVSSDDPTPTAGPAKTPTSSEPELVEVAAPIDSVTINIAESFPPQYFVRIVSGLPNGCARFNDYTMTRSGDTITFEVTNLEPKPGQLIACTEIYGFHEENVNLGTDFEGGKTYTVAVNDVTETFVAQGGEVDGEDELGRVTERAPIRDVRIDVNTSGTDHLVVVSGLLNSCHEFAEYTVQRRDDEITVEVLNYRNDMEYIQVSAADASYTRANRILDVVCAVIYRTVETEIEIGDDIEACKVYTVNINRETREVMAVAPNVRCAAPDQGGAKPSSTNGRTSVVAPIESAQVVSTRSIPPQHTLVVTLGLPNGCAEFGGYELAQEGNEIRVMVTNTIPTATDIMCTEQYRTVETLIRLGSDFEPGDYLVVVNGDVMAKFRQLGPVRPGTGRDGVVSVPAPIDDVVVISTRSIPPQHTLVITSGLPNGCAEFDSYTVARDGTEIRVRVTNTEPAEGQTCTDDYRTVVTRVDLGGDLKSGTYTVDVNGTQTSFTHIALPAPPSGITTIVLAPIENVTIQADGTGYVATVTSGLPNGCTRFGNYAVSRDGNTITVKVTNTLPADPQIMCTMVYGLVKTVVPLGSDFQSGTTYVVDVNGKRTTFTAGAASSSSTREVEAPIISVEISVAESYPVQYFAVVESGLPGSCVLFDRYEEVRTQDVIEISVYNREPNDRNGCIDVQGSHVSNIPLGVSFEPGKKFTVVVNGESTSFTAEGTVPDEPEEARIGTPFNLPLGLSVQVGGVQVRFDEVLEDSRCPANVVCVWEGRARVQISIDIDGTGQKPVELALEGVREDTASEIIDGYFVRLEGLNPYPGTTGDEKPEYVATLQVIDMMPDDAVLELRAEPDSDNSRTVRLVASIVGGQDNDRDLYCNGFEWSFGDGSPGVAAMPSCILWTADVKIPRKFEMTHTYERAGTFEATFSYGPLGPVEVKVEVK